MRKAERKAAIHGLLTEVNHLTGNPLQAFKDNQYHIGALDFQYDGDQSNSYSIYQIINKNGGRWVIQRFAKLSDLHTYAEGMTDALRLYKNPHPSIKTHEQR